MPVIWTIESIKTDWGFDKESFQETSPYLNLFTTYPLSSEGVTHLQAKEVLQAYAHQIGVPKTTFMQFYNKFKKDYKQKGVASSDLSIIVNPEGEKTHFADGPASIKCGSWTADECGIRKYDAKNQLREACPHPIMPTRIIRSIETGKEKVEIKFKTVGSWHTITVDRSIIADHKKIVALADDGIAVTTITAKDLVTYLSDCMKYNDFPQVLSTDQVGFVSNGHTFIPYDSEIEFDDNTKYRKLFRSIHSNGDEKAWFNCISKVRQESLAARLVISASFASVCLCKIGGLSFFVHLCGPTGCGKSVAQMCAASVWGNPRIGEYIQSFNGTSLGLEESAGFLKDAPLIIDELEHLINRGKDPSREIYALSQGISRTRSTNHGGLDKIKEWNLVIITSGERSLTQMTSTSGALNRVLEIKCSPVEKIIQNGNVVAPILEQNYGFGGPYWIEQLKDETVVSEIKEMNGYFLDLMLKEGITSKQAMAGALVAAVDQYLARTYFTDDPPLKASDYLQFLKRNEEVDPNVRADALLWGLVAENLNKFYCKGEVISGYGPVWGRDTGDTIIFNKTVLDRELQNLGSDPKMYYDWLDCNSRIIWHNGRRFVAGSVLSQKCNTVEIKKPVQDLEDPEETDLEK